MRRSSENQENSPRKSHVYRSKKPGTRSVLHRQDVACLIKTQCGACRYVNEPYKDGLNEKHEKGIALFEAEGLLDRARVVKPVEAPRKLNYRTLMKLAVRPYSVPPNGRPSPEQPRFAIGLFQPGSHRVVLGMESCPVHTRSLTNLLRDSQQLLEESTLQPFQETNGAGDLRYLVARSAHMTDEVMVTFVVNQPVKLELQRIVAALKRKGHRITAAFMNVNSVSGNAIFGNETIHLVGQNALRERVCDLDFEIGPTSFFQVNPWQASNLYHRLENLIGDAGKKTVAWDLYCGLGQISLVLARKGFKVLGVEENPESVVFAERNALKNDLAGDASFIAAKIEDLESEMPVWAKKPDVIVVNPARRGLHERARMILMHALRENPKTKFLYVSCDASTLARDAAFFKKAGIHLKQLEAFDMFAQTEDLEWLAVFGVS